MRFVTDGSEYSQQVIRGDGKRCGFGLEGRKQNRYREEEDNVQVV